MGVRKWKAVLILGVIGFLYGCAMVIESMDCDADYKRWQILDLIVFESCKDSVKNKEVKEFDKSFI